MTYKDVIPTIVDRSSAVMAAALFDIGESSAALLIPYRGDHTAHLLHR